MLGIELGFILIESEIFISALVQVNYCIFKLKVNNRSEYHIMFIILILRPISYFTTFIFKYQLKLNF